MVLAITKQDATARLAEFLPHAGGAYAKRRNYDYGPGAHDHVSRLSGALARRTITEQEVIEQTLAAHSFGSSEKFVQEVFWRTYWKGWLEMRPSLWTDYQNAIDTGFAASKMLEDALTGQTNIACFDAWQLELVETNYLHNHARMWFASIWIHTLGLPWQAGADFFMRHLIDGDAASNTLGWRWVAGLQTRGKAYGARADNIAQYTNGRFTPYGDLQEDVVAIAGPENPPASPVRAPRHCGGTKPLLLVTPEDCQPETLALPDRPLAVAALPADLVANRAPEVIRADQIAMSDGLARAKAHYKTEQGGVIATQDWQDDLTELMTATGADHIVMAFQPTGAWHDRITQSRLPIKEVMRAYDGLCWPHAKKGFFPFKEKIPHFIASI